MSKMQPAMLSNMKDENPYKKYYYDYCVNCSNNICKEIVVDDKFLYNDFQKGVIQDCAKLKRMIKLIKGD